MYRSHSTASWLVLSTSTRKERTITGLKVKNASIFCDEFGIVERLRAARSQRGNKSGAAGYELLALV